MLDKVAKATGARFILGAPMLHPADSRFMVEFVKDGILKYVSCPYPVRWTGMVTRISQILIVHYPTGNQVGYSTISVQGTSI